MFLQGGGWNSMRYALYTYTISEPDIMQTLSGSCLCCCCCYFCERDDSDNMFAPNFGVGAKNKPRRLIIDTLKEHVTKPSQSCLINHTPATNSRV